MKTYRMLLAECGYADYDRAPSEIAASMGLHYDGHDWPPELQEADRFGLDAPVEGCSMSQREMIDHETQRAGTWKARADAAEQWWSQAAPLLAEISRKHTLDCDLNTKVRELMEWEPA